MKNTFKCYSSDNDKKFLISRHFLLVYNNQSLEMLWMNLSQQVYFTPNKDFGAVTSNALDDGWGATYPRCFILSAPPPQRLWSSDCVQIMKMTFNCYISENVENFLISRHFLLVYNNQLLEMPWMTGGGATYPSWFILPHQRRWSCH